MDQEENAQDDDDTENFGLENVRSPIGTSEDEVYDEYDPLFNQEGNAQDDSLEATNRKHKQEQVDNVYKNLQDKIYLKDVLLNVINYDRFIISGKSLDYKMEDGNIINLRKKNGDYYALSHFKISFIRNELSRMTNISKKLVRRLQSH